MCALFFIFIKIFFPGKHHWLAQTHSHWIDRQVNNIIFSDITSLSITIPVGQGQSYGDAVDSQDDDDDGYATT